MVCPDDASSSQVHVNNKVKGGVTTAAGDKRIRGGSRVVAMRQTTLDSSRALFLCTGI